ncbi:MAG TPA: hypothetical protein PK990_05115 [Salinivirgaceae bacterium]|nr:hypothetical protein [Salinivirgaceae bacterium]
MGIGIMVVDRWVNYRCSAPDWNGKPGGLRLRAAPGGGAAGRKTPPPFVSPCRKPRTCSGKPEMAAKIL